ncbi:hypothetical protein [Desulfotomaculum sp. 1211_IL3151]|uniref:hypothetical protein n=1 Tax=Desulfotomaculum sp. 1211_IL3151 TaxID=3084055 RepID=UPI002FDAFCD1
MTEQKLADRFSHDLEVILQSGRDPEEVASKDEYRQNLKLASQIAKIDYSGESKIQRTLKESLLAKLAEGKVNQVGLEQAADELSDSELDMAAGGLGDPQQQFLCPKCGAILRGSHCPGCRYQT